MIPKVLVCYVVDKGQTERKTQNVKKEEEEEQDGTRGTTTARARERVSQCPLTTDGCRRTGRPRYTSTRLSSVRITYRVIYVFPIHMHRARAGFCTIVRTAATVAVGTKLKLYRGKSVLPWLV